MTNQNFRVKNGLEVGNNIKIDSGSGIITATKFVGDGSSLTNVSGGGASDFVRNSVGIHTLSNVGVGTTAVTAVLNIGSPSVASTSNYVITYGNFDVRYWGGIGTYSAKHFDFTTDGNNNTYVVGGLYSDYYSNGFDQGNPNYPSKSFICKINSSQNLEWHTSLSSSTADYNKSSEVCGICSATNGDVVVAMKSYRFLNSSYVEDGLSQLSFVKINTSGSIQWQTTINNIQLNYGEYRTVAVDADAITQRKIFLTTDSNGNIYASGRSTSYPFIVKLDSSGNVSYSKILYNTIGPGQFVLKNSSLYWFGQVTSSGRKIRVVKFDLNADIIWDKWFNINSVSTVNGNPLENTKFNVDDNENIYFFTRIVDLYSYGYLGGGYGHGYVVEKYDSSLVRQWTKRINTTVTGGNGGGDVFYAYPGAIEIDSNQNVYILAPNNNEKSRHPFGYDVFKLNSSGDYIWKRFLSVPNLNYETSFSNTLQYVLSSKLEIKGNSLKFAGDVATPNISKDILSGDTAFNRETNPQTDWWPKQNSDTISVLVSNLNLDGDCIGLYGSYAVEDLEITRNHDDLKYVSNNRTTSVVTDILNSSGVATNFYRIVSNVGIGSTVGVSTFTTGSISLNTETLVGPGFLSAENYPHFKRNFRKPFDLTVSGTTKLSKLIVEDIEFSSTGQSIQTIAIGYSSGFRKNVAGNGRETDFKAKYNTFIGSYTSPQIEAYYPFQYNNFIGHRAGNYSSESYANNFIGAFTGYYNGGCYNNFIGMFAGYGNSWGQCNVFIGCRAGSFMTGSNASIAIGAGAGGFGGGYGAWANIFLGYYAGAKTPNNMCYYGYNDGNTFIGIGAGKYAAGNYNNFFGAYAGATNVTGGYNNFFGYCNGYSNQTGYYNNFFGAWTGHYNNTGNYNNFFGSVAGYCNSIGNRNIYLGSYSGISTSSSSKVIIGSGYNWSNFFDSPDTTKDIQFAVGIRTDTNPSKYWITGDENMNLVFYNSVIFNDDNIKIGYYAGGNAVGGSNNVFIGYGAGYNNSGASDNNFIGNGAGYYNTTGINNSFFGEDSGNSNTIGCCNSFFGRMSGCCNTTGSRNSFFGTRSGSDNRIGNYNLFLGAYSGISTASSNKVIIGVGTVISNTRYLFDSPDTNKNTQLAIGVRKDANPSNYWLVGDENFNIGIGTTNPGPGIKLDVLGGEIRAGRVDASSEGGQVSFSRASDNLTAWYIDVYGNTSTPSLRFVDVSNSAVRAEINGSGNFIIGGDAKVGVDTSKGVVLTSPNGTQYRLVVDNSGNLTTTLV